MTSIPAEITPLLSAWCAALARTTLPVQGVYLFGSLALDDWNPAVSDIDAMVVTALPATPAEVSDLAELHRDLLARFPLARRLEVQYLSLAQVEEVDGVESYPCFRDGEFFPASRGDLNAVTRWLLHHRGITVTGKPAAELFPEVPWSDIEQAMTYNLDTYWKRQVDESGRMRFLSDFWAEFAVTTLCRIVVTLRDRDIVSKETALHDAHTHLPAQWVPLVDEALRLRQQPGAPSCYANPHDRMEDTIAFIGWVRESAQR